MPSVLGGGLHFRMGVVGFFPCTDFIKQLLQQKNKPTTGFPPNLHTSCSQAICAELHLL